MAAFYTVAAKNAMLAGLGAVLVQASLHSDNPGTDGLANELSGGSPAYARKVVTLDVPTGGEAALVNDVTFNVPPGSVVKWVGFWNSGGTEFFGAAPVTAETYGAQGTYTVPKESAFDMSA